MKIHPNFVQNEVAASKGISPAAPSNFKPVIKKSVTYIVAAVLVNEHGDVLMMQVGTPWIRKVSMWNFIVPSDLYAELE
jgi:hypothetical protein